MKLSVLMPIFNERNWLEKAVQKILNIAIEGIDALELILVDDGSMDGTAEIVQKLYRENPKQIYPIFHKKNMGKGAAIKSAISKMTGDICIIQDADLEYDPSNYSLLLEPILSGHADCVYGSRFAGSQSKRVLLFWHYMGNQVLTLFSNMLTNLNLTDMETGYKAFRADILKTIPIRSSRFGFEPEITAKVAKRHHRIYEVGISYYGRTYSEGKKITWLDGLKAIFIIIKYWLIDDLYKDPDQ